MNKTLFQLLTIFCLFFAVQADAQVTTAYYQPTPFPSKRCVETENCPGGNMSDPKSGERVRHADSCWISNSGSNSAMVCDDKLQVGGPDDNRTYIRFDVEGLPKRATVQLGLQSLTTYPNNDVPGLDLWKPSSPWVKFSWDSAPITWSTQPPLNYYSNPKDTFSYAAGSTLWLDITTLYNAWQQKSEPNNGISLLPLSSNLPLNQWWSTEFRNYAVDKFADAKRPLLYFLFPRRTDIPKFKMPLPGGYRWQLSGEAGGYECLGENPFPDHAHLGKNFFSYDFSKKSLKYGGTTEYPSSTIPILAPFSGTVIDRGGNDIDDDRGYFITLDHGNGFQTRYLHLSELAARANNTLLENGNTVNQGDQIGKMGTTGKYWDTKTQSYQPSSTGVHLHMNFWYKDPQTGEVSGASDVENLTYVTMSNWLLKSFQTECFVDSNGVPYERIRYYTSNNTPTRN